VLQRRVDAGVAGPFLQRGNTHTTFGQTCQACSAQVVDGTRVDLRVSNGLREPLSLPNTPSALARKELRQLWSTIRGAIDRLDSPRMDGPRYRSQ